MTEGANDGQYDARNDVGMGFVWLLVVIVLILAAAALIKNLRTGTKGRSAMSKLVIIGLSTIALSSQSSAQHGDVALLRQPWNGQSRG